MWVLFIYLFTPQKKKGGGKEAAQPKVFIQKVAERGWEGTGRSGVTARAGPSARPAARGRGPRGIQLRPRGAAPRAPKKGRFETSSSPRATSDAETRDFN